MVKEGRQQTGDELAEGGKTEEMVSVRGEGGGGEAKVDRQSD
jgi:hypothetical protein